MFQCEVREGGDRVRWLKNDTPLQLDHRMTVLPSGGLEIRNVNYPDRGSYSCIAGSLVSSKADLNLKALVANPAPEPPSFLVTPVGRSVVVGQEVTLECSANGLPQPALKPASPSTLQPCSLAATQTQNNLAFRNPVFANHLEGLRQLPHSYGVADALDAQL